MRYSRTPISASPAYSLAGIKLYTRVDHTDEDTLLAQMGETAVNEIQQYCDVALVTQSIVATADSWSSMVQLPVGPFNAQALAANPVTVQVRDEEGNLTSAPAGWWIEGGRYPLLHLPTTTTGAQLVVTYPAGYGATLASIPADLSIAVSDHAAMLYDRRAEIEGQGLSIAAARICARHRKVRA